MTPARDFSTRPRPRALTRAEAGVVFAGLAALALAAWSAADAWAEHRAAAARLWRAASEAEAARTRIRQLQGGTDAADEVASQAALGAEAPPERVIAEIAALLPADVRLESVMLTYGRELPLELRVAARDPAAFDVFLDRLQRSRAFTAVLPGDEDRRGDMRAVVRARYVAEAP